MAEKKQYVVIPTVARTLLREVGNIVENAGMSSYVVGGCVRDWLLGKSSVVDLDVMVVGDARRAARLISRKLNGSLKTHEPFGTATISLKKKKLKYLDVATCRRETYSKPAAYPRVFPGTLRQDLLRRDFTINAMAVSLNSDKFGMLIDPFKGSLDLKKKQLRILHQRSFIDDPSRMLRGIRFIERFKLKWETRTAAALKSAVKNNVLAKLNTGRIRKELIRMLDEPNPRTCFEAAAEMIGGMYKG